MLFLVSRIDSPWKHDFGYWNIACVVLKRTVTDTTKITRTWRHRLSASIALFLGVSMCKSRGNSPTANATYQASPVCSICSCASSFNNWFLIGYQLKAYPTITSCWQLLTCVKKRRNSWWGGLSTVPSFPLPSPPLNSPQSSRVRDCFSLVRLSLEQARRRCWTRSAKHDGTNWNFYSFASGHRSVNN